jgi:hypothetical protein
MPVGDRPRPALLLNWHRIDQPRLLASETHSGASWTAAAKADPGRLLVSERAATPSGQRGEENSASTGFKAILVDLLSVTGLHP